MLNDLRAENTPMNVQPEPVMETYKEFITKVRQQPDEHLDGSIQDYEEEIREMEEEERCLRAELEQEMKDLKKYVELLPEDCEKAIERYEEAKENLEERMDEVREIVSGKRAFAAVLRYESARRLMTETLQMTW
jgi:ATP/maltotriose-dependent transcriptional regulator MalT